MPGELGELVAPLGRGPWTVIWIIVVIYLLLGTVLESLSMILLSVPDFHPLVYRPDFGAGPLAGPGRVLIWFAVIVVVTTEISLVTPPVGMNVFVLRSVLPDVPPSTTFRGIFWFWVSEIVRTTPVAVFPAISLGMLQLPRRAGGLRLPAR